MKLIGSVGASVKTECCFSFPKFGSEDYLALVVRDSVAV
jgi:hypothetical protein